MQEARIRNVLVFVLLQFKSSNPPLARGRVISECELKFASSFAFLLLTFGLVNEM